MNQEGQRYAAKRVRVVVEGTRAGKPVKETVETVIAPRVSETPPPTVPIAAAPAIADTCPAAVTATGSPAVVGWNRVSTDTVTGYRVYVNGALRTTIAVVAGRSRYTWTSPLYASATTYEVRGLSTTGVAAACPVIAWNPANPG